MQVLLAHLIKQACLALYDVQNHQHLFLRTKETNSLFLVKLGTGLSFAQSKNPGLFLVISWCTKLFQGTSIIRSGWGWVYPLTLLQSLNGFYDQEFLE